MAATPGAPRNVLTFNQRVLGSSPSALTSLRELFGSIFGSSMEGWDGSPESLSQRVRQLGKLGDAGHRRGSGNGSERDDPCTS